MISINVCFLNPLVTSVVRFVSGTLPETNIAIENSWLGDYFPSGNTASFQLLVLGGG